MSFPRSRTRLAAAALAAVVASVSLVGCQDDGGVSDGSGSLNQDPAGNGADSPGESPEAAAPAQVTANVSRGQRDVAVDTSVGVKVSDGTIERVVFTRDGKDKALSGTMNEAKTSWRAGDLLEPGTAYVVTTTAVNSEGRKTTSRTPFRTQNLTLDEQTYPSLTPLQGETVGVGMPVIILFDIPVKNRAAIERHLEVTAKPATAGTWSWISDQEVHWRPRQYWEPGTKVHVDVDINGVDAGNGIYGQMDRSLDFKIGKSVIMKTNLQTHQMKVVVDGNLARTIPITGGKPGFETRSGTKLIIEKFVSKRMDAATVGYQPGDAEYYNIPDVQYAQRVTYSGEFIHAAPWSVGSQGYSNVSHGCVGISTDNGAWLFSITHRGDPVEVTGTQRSIEPGNGWTDWDQSYASFKEGSAL